MTVSSSIELSAAIEDAFFPLLSLFDHALDHGGQIKSAVLTALRHAIHLEICMRGRKDIDLTHHQNSIAPVLIIGHVNGDVGNFGEPLRYQAG